MSNKNTQNNGAVDCIRCEVPVCIAAGFSPETKKKHVKKITLILIILEKYSQNIYRLFFISIFAQCEPCQRLKIE